MISTAPKLILGPLVFIAANVLLPTGNANVIRRFPADAFDDVDKGRSRESVALGGNVSRLNFNRMTIDPSTGSVFVGAVNHLFRLDPDELVVIGSRSLGPRLDDRRCTELFGADRCGAGGSTAYVAKPTDNYVKVLVVDASRGRLVVCGSTFQGTCELLDPDMGPRRRGSTPTGGELSSPSSPSRVSAIGFEEAASFSRPPRGNTDYFVAANDPDLSTIGFVAPGPGGHAVLYVAATYSGSASIMTSNSASVGISGFGTAPLLSSSSSSMSSSSSSAAAAVSAVRQAVPAVSSRSLVPGSSAFRFVHVDGLTGGTAVRFRSEAIERFPVEYVSGFDGRDGFSYFLSVQPESFEMSGSGVLPPTVSAEIGSRIIQVCQNDRNYYSYVEIPIRCRPKSNSADRDADGFNVVTAAVLARPGFELARQLGADRPNEQVVVATFTAGRPPGRGSGHSGWRTSSAVCVYRLADIRARFTQNVQRCFAAEQRHVGVQFGNRMCVSLGMQINSSYCGEIEQNGPLVGTIPIESSPTLVFDNTHLTGVATSIIEDQTVAFLGTSDGHLKKVVLQSDRGSYEFRDVEVISGSPVNKDLLLNTNETHIYVMTANQVTRLPVSECGAYSTCELCRGARNPYCGWCSLEKRCSTKSVCSDSHQDKRWLSSFSWECLRIPPQFVNPVSVGIKRSVQVSVGIKALPVLGDAADKYVCVFGANWSISVGAVSPNEIKCWTPPPQMFLSLFQSHLNDHVNVTLSIRSTRTGVDFIDTTLIFFDCSKHSTCSVCTQSPWSCSWCVHRSQCLQAEDAANCRGPVVKEAELCPHLKHVPGSPQLLIPVGVQREIHLPAANLPTTKGNDRGYECLLHLTSPPLQVPARRESSTLVVCEPFMYWYDPDESQKTASLEVVVNGRYLVEDSYGITVTLFKCNVMAPDCSTCLSLQEAPHSAKFNCQWCDDRCQHNSTCNRQMAPIATKCPMPVIESVHPLTGLVDGGISVTVKGLNLGTNYDQVRQSVTVAGVTCEVLASGYIVSRQIVCKTGPMGAHQQGPVIITVGEAVVSSDHLFKYQNFRVASIVPLIGPLAGGTEVTFTGQDLDTGANVQVLFDTIPCSVDRNYMNRTYFVCITSPVSSPLLLPIELRIDEAVLQLNDEFEYSENPTITDIDPLSAFKSGGRVITVTGSHLKSVSKPMMHLYNHQHRFTSNCTTFNDVTMFCPSPAATLHGGRLSMAAKRSFGGTSFHEYLVGFTMDAVQTVRDLSVYFPDVRSTLTVHADPTYDKFRNGKKVYKGEALILTGTRLNVACDVDEILVWIGNASCKVNSIDSTTLYCSPPPVQPPGLSASGELDSRALPVVRVSVGRIEFVLGHLEYQKFELAGSEYWVLGVAIGGGSLLTVVMVILIVYKRKSTRAQRQFRRLQQQLDSLESNIRNECKQAFAELQTEVTDFTSDLNGIGIPFWDYRSYTLHVFFPTAGDTADQLLYCDAKMTSSVSSSGAMNKFYQLLSNDCFLLIFIRVLDNQQTFSIRHKSKVASLLTTVFHNKLDYLTLILKVLLGELIDRSLERKQPKLMLRRTEFVVEKLLTNWLSLCMFGYTKKRVSTALFMLFKAIKHQVNKGPVDAVTFEARYALSEDRLLREKIEAKPLTIYVISEAGNQDPVVCKMLDCDTISQAKEKALDCVFKNTPFSKRPLLDDIDLELLAPSGGRSLLSDEDSTTVTLRHSQRKLNTLEHYRVADWSTIAIVKARLHQNGFHHDDVKKSTTLRKASPASSTSDNTTKLIHLVKNDDAYQPGREQKVMSEIFLTRLLATKCTLQQYVDDLFSTILEIDIGGRPPIAIKYLFDFFDVAARRHGITDPEVVHTWKSNSLLLRFWVNIIKNPEFVFDVNKSHVVDSCLSVVAQTFMDSCSIQEQRLGKDSPSSKLLYAKDIPRYRSLVMQFYRDVEDMNPVSDAQMGDFLMQHSETYPVDFRTEVGLLELLKFAKQYEYELLERLDEDSEARPQQLAARFEDLMSTIDNDVLR